MSPALCCGAHLCFINLKDGGGAPLILDGLCEVPLVSNQLPAVLPPSEHWRWLTLGIVCVEYVKTDSSRIPKMKGEIEHETKK